jgi:integrase
MFDNILLSNTKTGLNYMNSLITDKSTVEDIEMVMLPRLCEMYQQEAKEAGDALRIEIKVKTKVQQKEEMFYEQLSKRSGIPKEELCSTRIPRGIIAAVLDEVFGDPTDLIQPSHDDLKYSMIKYAPSLRDYIPKANSRSGGLGHRLFDPNAARHFERIQEYNTENTKRAYNSDLIYWQAWLAAVGFDFKQPVNEAHVNAFIVQHAESMIPEIDERLVKQGYKYELGTHSMSTIKRRVTSLRIFLKLEELPNPCDSPKIRMLLSKLTKKYGGTKSRGLAITKEVLDDFLSTCESKLIDVRDKALLLFAWSSGGRRRSEVTDAMIEDLSPLNDGNFLYRMPKNKTDQKGEGLTVPIKGRAAHALGEWLKTANITSGPIFRPISKKGEIGDKGLCPIDVFRIVQKRAELAGYDPKKYGAHSLRSGFITEGGRRGKPLGDIMGMTGHKSVSIAMNYYKAGAAVNNSAANLAD